MSEFPSNSKHVHLPPQSQPNEPPPVEKVISGTAVRRKMTVGRRVSSFFTGADSQSVAEHIVFDYVWPSLKMLFVDATIQGIEQRVLGGQRLNARPPGVRGFGAHPLSAPMNYAGFSNPAPPMQQPGRDLSRRGRANHYFNEVEVPTRAEALDVIDRLGRQLATYGVVTVADFYNAVGISPEFTDRDWGWTDLSMVSPVRSRNNLYIINIGRPQPIN